MTGFIDTNDITAIVELISIGFVTPSAAPTTVTTKDDDAVVAVVRNVRRFVGCLLLFLL